MHKFILFEGVDGSGKSSLAKLLAEKIGAIYYHSPPEAIEPLHAYANDSSARIRFQYFLLGNYITSEELREILKTKSVVVDKYIYSTAAFHSVLLDEKIELQKDVLMPDCTFYLHASIDKIKERLENRDQTSKYEEIEFLGKVEKKYREILQAERNIFPVDTTNLSPAEALAVIESSLQDII